MVAGAALLFFSLRRSKHSSVQASDGSVAVGGNSYGNITNVKMSAPSTPSPRGHGLTVLAVIVEVVGIGVTLWHAFHLATR